MSKCILSLSYVLFSFLKRMAGKFIPFYTIGGRKKIHFGHKNRYHHFCYNFKVLINCTVFSNYAKQTGVANTNKGDVFPLFCPFRMVECATLIS